MAKEGTNGDPPDHIVGIPFVVGNEVIRRHLRQEHQNRSKTCKGCGQSETLMSGPVSSRTKGPQAMSRQKLRVAVELLTGHTTVKVQCLNSDSHRGKTAECAGTKGRQCTYCTVCHCAALACKRYRNLGRVFLTPKGLENMRVNGLINLVANTRLGILK